MKLRAKDIPSDGGTILHEHNGTVFEVGRTPAYGKSSLFEYRVRQAGIGAGWNYRWTFALLVADMRLAAKANLEGKEEGGDDQV